MGSEHQLDRYLPRHIRAHIEQHYYARVNEQAHLEHIIRDPEFLRDPAHYVALFADHGVVHVRDVAGQILQVLDTINGVLIPARSESRLELMRAYGVIMAYLHDIGMADFSPFGRTMHPEFATQMVFDAEFDRVVAAIWDENRGNLAGSLAELARRGILEQEPRIVFRELLSMANCHSKSKVPVRVLNDAGLLRQAMQATLVTDLQVLYHTHRVEKARGALLKAQQGGASDPELSRLAEALRSMEEDQAGPSAAQPAPLRRTLHRFYDDTRRDSFRWLLATHDDARALRSDVVDTLRALRCADALRQRGTVLKTSGSYEIFVDRTTANAIYALRGGDEQLFLLGVTDSIAAGEANLASSELGRDGNLHVSFHRGAFADLHTTRHAALSAALVVNDIQLDVIESFERPAIAHDRGEERLKTHQEMLILLESVDDNLQFADLVSEQLQRIDPRLRDRIGTVPSLREVPAQERARYLEGAPYDPDSAGGRELLDHVARSGHDVEHIDPVEAFKHVKQVLLHTGETLIEAGFPASFVYIPMGDGLEVIPLGGYEPFPVSAWMPLGVTGVIRGAARNATVVARQDLALLMIPKEIYLRQWHHPLSAAELVQRLAWTPPTS